MNAKIKLSHPNPLWRGKEGLVVGWTVPEKKVYTYSPPKTENNENGMVFIPNECMKRYPVSQKNLIERGFVEDVTTYNVGKAKVKLYIETINRTSANGFTTLMAAVWPYGYSTVEVDEDDIEEISFDVETRSSD